MTRSQAFARRRPGLRLALGLCLGLGLAAVASIGAAAARAQEGAEQATAYLPVDDEVRTLLRKAAELEAEGRVTDAVLLYLRVEDVLAERRVADPTARFVHAAEPGILSVHVGVEAYLRARVAALPGEGLERYRLARDPRAKELLDTGVATGGLEPLEVVATRYALTTHGPEAMARLADLALERGELARAARAYGRLLERAGDRPVVVAGEVPREAALKEPRLQLALVVARGAVGDAAGARRAADALVASAGASATVEAFGAKLTAAEAAARAVAAGRRLAEASGSVPRGPWPTVGGSADRGAASPARALPGRRWLALYTLPGTEVTRPVLEGYGRRGVPAPLPAHAVASGDSLFLADAKSVVAVGLADGWVRWSYAVGDVGSVPGRLANDAWACAVAGDRVYATLCRSTPPDWDGDEPRRAPDWRLVCLDARTGRLLWDAADREDLGVVSRDAMHVSAPLVASGRVYLGVALPASGGAQAHVLALDATTGAPVFRTFVGSATPDDHLGLAAQPAPLLESEGRLFFQSNVGVVAALDPADGAILWAARTPTYPLASQRRVIRAGRRTEPTPPRAAAGVAVAAPQDSPFVHAYELATGRELWRFPHDRLRQGAGIAAGACILAGEDGVVALDVLTGRVRYRTEPLGRPLRGAPFASDAHVYVPAADRLAVFDSRTGAAVGSYRFAPGDEGAGNVLVLAEAVVLSGPGRLDVFEDRERSIRTAEEAARIRPDDPRPHRDLGDIHARWGRYELALEHLGRAAELAAARGAELRDLAAIVREEAFQVARLAAERRAEAGDRAGFAAFGDRALALGRPSPELADLARRVGDAHEAAGQLGSAIAAYRRLLEPSARDLALELGPGLAVPAGAFARRRLHELRKRPFADDAFAAYDRESERALELARKAGTPDLYLQLLDGFPASRGEPRAMLALAALYERRGLPNFAIRHLSEHAERYPTAEEAPLVLLKLALLCDRARRIEEARRAFQGAEQRFAGKYVDLGGARGRVEAAGFARAELLRLDREHARPSLPTGEPEEVGLSRSFVTGTNLEDDEAALLTPRGFDPDRSDIFLVAERRAVEARLLETGVRLWRHELEYDLDRERVSVAGGTLVLPAGEEIHAIDLARGRPLWTRVGEALTGARPGDAPAAPAPVPAPPAPPAPPGGAGGAPGGAAPPPAGGPGVVIVPPGGPGGAPDPGAAPGGGPRPAPLDPDPLKGVAAIGPSRVVAIVGRSVLAFDPDTGRTIWRVDRKEPLAGDPLPIGPADAPGAAPTHVAVASETPARVIVLALENGAVRAEVDLASRDPRLSIRPTALGPGRLVAVVGGSEIFAVDALGGRVVWARRLAYWPRELVAAPDGSAVAVVPFLPGDDQPRLAVIDGATGETRWVWEHDKKDPAAVGAIAWDGDRLYAVPKDFVTPRVRCLEARTGAERWTFKPPRGHSFEKLLVTRDHVVLPQVGPSGPPVVYLIDRDEGVVHRQVALEARRVNGAAVIGGVLLVPTNRGVTGFARLEPARLRTDVAEIASELAARPPELPAGEQARRAAYLRSLLADRQFKLGDLDRAIAILEEAVQDEDLRVEDYDLLYGQLMACVEARPVLDRMEVRKVARAPDIDGELRDWWPIHQSVRIARPREIAPIQGAVDILAGGVRRPGILRGEEDLSATLYLAYDERYFYFALDVEDSILQPYDSEAPEWKGDCLLIAIDSLGNGGDFFLRDDNLLSLALTLPRKQKPAEEEEESEPEGKYFVRRKDDLSGCVYEVAMPWKTFRDHGCDIDLEVGPKAGFTFGFNVVLTDDDGRGANKALSWTPSIWLHKDRAKLLHGFIPGRFGKVILR